MQNDENSSFDPNSYLDAQITEPSIRRPPLPAGSEWIATVGEPKMREWKKKDDPSITGIACDVMLKIDLSQKPAMEGFEGITEVNIGDGIMLNTDAQKKIDNSPGKNARLRQYREALNMNNPGEAFSFRNMQGRQLKVRIKHDPYQGEMYDKIDAVSKP